MRKTTKSNKMTRLRRTQRGGFIPILRDIHDKVNEIIVHKIPKDDENNRLSMLAKMTNMKELLSELLFRKGEIVNAIKKSKTGFVSHVIKRTVSNRYNDNWFSKNFITPEQVDDYYDYHKSDTDKKFHKKVEIWRENKLYDDQLDFLEKKVTQNNNIPTNELEQFAKNRINERTERAKRIFNDYKDNIENTFKLYVCNIIATYLKQLHIIITGSKSGITERPNKKYDYSCDEISKFPSITEEKISEENRTLLSNILGQDAMANFIQNYNDVKYASDKHVLNNDDVKIDDVNMNVATGDMNADTDTFNKNMDGGTRKKRPRRHKK